MRTVLAISIVAIVCFLCFLAARATLRPRQPPLGFGMRSSAAASCSSCTPNCCTVMRTVQETVYEERPMDVYHIEYGEVKDKVKIPVVKYKEDTAYRCCCVTVYQLPPPCACPPVNTCAPAADCAKGNCGPAGCPETLPCQGLEEVPLHDGARGD